MNRRLLIIFLIAFVVAAVCARFIYLVVGTRLSAAHPASTIHVVTAAKDIKLGTVLTASDLTSTELTGPAPKGAIFKPENAI